MENKFLIKIVSSLCKLTCMAEVILSHYGDKGGSKYKDVYYLSAYCIVNLVSYWLARVVNLMYYESINLSRRAGFHLNIN